MKLAFNRANSLISYPQVSLHLYCGEFLKTSSRNVENKLQFIVLDDPRT